MSELKLPRLLAAAKEFNVGQDTIIEFLGKKGFNKDELKPTAKLSVEMYLALQAEFQSDKQAKNKADQVEIPKIAPAEPRKRKDEEEVSFKKEEKKSLPKEEPKETVKETESESVQKKTTPAEVPTVELPSEPILTEAPIIQEKHPEPEVIVPEKSAEDDFIKLEVPEIEGPKIIAKIDLDAIDTSTRPKKSSRKKEDTSDKKEPIVESTTPVTPRVQPEEITVVAKEEQPTATPAMPETTLPVTNIESNIPQQDGAPVIENIEVEKLTGPKILGKIQLPIDSDTRPKPSSREESRKQRKRIPLNKVGGNQPGGQFNREPKAGGGPRQSNVAAGATVNAGGTPVTGPNRPIQPANNRNNQPQGGGGTGGNRNNNNRHTPHQRGAGRDHRKEEKEIDAKDIQEKIKETQAKLAGAGGRGKSLKAKYRRAKRDEAAESMGELSEDNKLQVTEFISVSELANLMDVSFADVIGKCMNLGIMVSINQRLDAEVIELVASEFGYEVEFIGVDDVDELNEEEEEEDTQNLVSRPPIVTIMGHVDHGKTSLLDYIRNANVVAGEAGGITQHIGAYEVTLPESGKHITFLDTPGHEAFTAMRARGAKVTDIAVIVIAADDAVMPQTKEAISHAQAANVPMIFAINKIDKEGANPQKIYEQLSNMNILVEEWGGKYQSQELSAKQGLNVDLLLEKILLEAELLDLKANPNKEASGSIIEATLDKGRGYVATILVQNGTLKQGDIIVSAQYYGRVKAMFNERNQKITEAPPSTPAVILGLNGAPQAGEKFKVYKDESEAKESANKRAQLMREQGLRARKHITLDEIGRRLALGNFKELNIIIKGDVDGSIEALSDSLQKLSTAEIAVNVVHKAVGQISESDVLLATASDAILIGFNVRPSAQAARLAQNEGVEIKMYSIIYNAIEEVKSAMEGMLEPKIQEKEVATVEVREVYKFDKATVAGCFVLEGRIKRDAKIRLFRDGILIYPRQEGAFAELGSLKRYKDDVKEVPSNMECGLTIKNYTDLAVGDTIVAYEEVEIKRTL
ncbi:MAG: translation initiation factor IF-2 [Sphingobacteriales bacterium]|uniref:translation initiation factor IF-2 n=1 Tax=Hydrotalea flava TaxID=714549 RepID=UPI00082E4E36|nr:translation initiation factor IF-2 [Hydrotalea flava]RTL54257.1 MAG: translation initiation factor IF-2 [Sphingobacteriales bacterium]